MEYIAIKVKGLNHWLWFEKVNVSRDGRTFKGVKGWGKHGANTSIEIEENRIEGEIESDELQYGD